MLRSIFSLVVLTLVSAFAVNAQDDIYYTPSARTQQRETYSSPQQQNQYNNAAPNQQNNNSQNYNNAPANGGYQDYYEYSDDQEDYQYAQRVRRFARPVSGFSYYDNAYVDNYYYDPYYYNNYFAPRSSFSVSFGNPFWSLWSFRTPFLYDPWFSRYNYGYSSFGYSSFGYSSYCSPFGYSYGFGSPFYSGYGGSPFYHSYYGSNYYYPYSNGYDRGYASTYSNPKGTVYGVRTNRALNEPITPTGFGGRNNNTVINRGYDGTNGGGSTTNAARFGNKNMNAANATAAPSNGFNNTNSQTRSSGFSNDAPASNGSRFSRPQYNSNNVATPATANDRPSRGFSTTPTQQYSAPQRSYNAPSQQYSAPQRSYSAPVQQQHSFSAPAQHSFSAPSNSGGGGTHSSGGHSGGRH